MQKIAGTFYEKELQKINQEEFGLEKVINCMSNEKDMVVHSIVRLIN